MSVIPFPQSAPPMTFRWDRVLPRRVTRPVTVGLDGLTALLSAGLTVDAVLDLSCAAHIPTLRGDGETVGRRAPLLTVTIGQGNCDAQAFEALCNNPATDWVITMVEASGGFSKLCQEPVVLTTEYVHRTILNTRDPHLALRNACLAVFARSPTAFMVLSPSARSAMGCYRWECGTRFVRIGGPESPPRRSQGLL
ncbi:hypothetical protein [Actibacterium sp. 188UL27-1]|uniref:hypothetical protein n=1 Tax=Actibacterium sp. 188UL27-1 TaxID=2786961 RepID=UPI001959AD5D|nr:hypothetical protein [Actibacterium sp. 188UL27-1]MBM7067338.1 hypothetical protein [Actibacterium sp. 188UL27-1]